MVRIKYEVSPEYRHLEGWIKALPQNFASQGTHFFKNRNAIKIFEVEGMKLNVKEFKIPNLINRFAYVYLRGSKAGRSFQFARRLMALGASTPDPVGYIECIESGQLRYSYYVSLHLDFDYNLKTILQLDETKRADIFRQWVAFTYNKLHRNGVFHLDYSQGNTLITEKDGNYSFAIVDLNRMEFGEVSYRKGLTNFSQLCTNDKLLELIASEYARLNGKDEAEAVRFLIAYKRKSQQKHDRWEKIKTSVRRFFRSGRAAK